MNRTFVVSFLFLFVATSNAGTPNEVWASTENLKFGDGWPGRIEPYQATPELQRSLAAFSMKAGWFRRSDKKSTDESVNRRQCPTDDLPFLLFSPSKGRRLPLLMYFGGSGEMGTDLSLHFRQPGLFRKVCSVDFQKKHPCVVFSPMLPQGIRARSAQSGWPSDGEKLICDAMYAVIRSLGPDVVDTNRLYLAGLSLGGGIAFDMPCVYPGRFAGSIPVSTAQSSRMIPERQSGNYWLLHNRDSNLRPSAQNNLEEIERRVSAGGGEFRHSVFMSDGHNAWDAAWSEDAVWDWLFSKPADGRLVGHPALGRMEARPAAKPGQQPAMDLSRRTICSASIRGRDDRHAPERGADGLDSTCYISAEPMKTGDWWQIEFAEPISGKVVLQTGTAGGEGRLSKGRVETSIDGKSWSRRSSVSGKDGSCKFVERDRIRFLRLLPEPRNPEILIVRNLSVLP